MPQKLLDAINEYKKLRFTGYFFALIYSKKGKIIYDTNFLIRFEKENFRHLILGTKHLQNDHLIEANSKKLFDDFSKLTKSNYTKNKNFNLIVNDPNYNSIIDRLENIKNLDLLLKNKDIQVFQKSQSPNVLPTSITFDFLLKLNRYNDTIDTPFLFIERTSDNSVICNPVSTFRSDKRYEQNHKLKQVLTLDTTKQIYKN
ncbi:MULTISPECIES: hypothetical protein [unclassified Streptococcus]|uniref:hypothetical protein n=1 Tax=unclassified Streptococcus TaxID=2608887 RepID=UPI001563A86E|nr:MULTISPECIES: hypothetical protein [unclassified Streptococcus]